MRYNREDIEQQIIDELRGDPDLESVDIRTHAGDVSLQTLTDPAYWEGVTVKFPFIFIQYQGRSVSHFTDNYKTVHHDVVFRLYVGARNLRTGREAQMGCYKILDKVFDLLAGRWLASIRIPEVTLNLSGYPIRAASNTTPIVVEFDARFVQDGSFMYVRGVTGNTGANNTMVLPWWQIKKRDDYSVELLSSVGNGEYISGGTIITAMASEELNQLSFIQSTGAQDEQLLVNEPKIKVYSADYQLTMMA